MAKQDVHANGNVLSRQAASKEFKIVRRRYLRAHGWTLREAKTRFTFAHAEELMVEYVRHLGLIPDGALVKVTYASGGGWHFDITPRKLLS